MALDGSGDWWDWLKLAGSAAGALNSSGFNIGGGGDAVDASGVLGSNSNNGLPQVAPPAVGSMTLDTLGAPGAVPGMTPPPTNLGLPTPPVPPSIGAAAAPVAPVIAPPVAAPTGLMGGNAPLGSVPPDAAAPAATAAAAGQPGWLERNFGETGKDVSDKWDKAWTEDPKTGISPAQKVLAGFGAQAVSAANKAPAAPQFGGMGGGAVRPQQINAGQMALAREQQLALLKQRATLNAPWLRRYQQQGLMG